MPSTKRLLGLYAHPDDEILGPGGTIAHYAQEGALIEWVCATRGEAGEIAPEIDATPANLGAVREQEMLCAAHTLGIKKVHFLDYRDSGMAGTEDNQHPKAYVNSLIDDVVPRLVKIIRRLRPQVMLTFEPYGGYGHPDHITIHKHAHAALTAAADSSYHPELGSAWQASRLFYPLLRLFTFDAMKAKMDAKGLDTGFFKNIDKRREKAWPDSNFQCRIDMRHTFRRKWTAFHCHATQFGSQSVFRQLSDSEFADIFTHEYFALAYPQPANGLMLDDLFANLIR
ncbi:MAG: hypothetical protein DWQ04_17110 [Chloroflexi bacterium]|nr:MAG: hypothetical protein DWQ04_17110 [Chloroflexota bacterium]